MLSVITLFAKYINRFITFRVSYKRIIKTNSKYLPNLDGLRCLGAIVILLFHVEAIKNFAGKNVIHKIWRFNPLGNVDISLFFVLSGFIISYLLFTEKKENGDINLKKFYARRILKIWPLYYFIILLGFFVLPRLDSFFSIPYSPWVHGNFYKFLVSALLFLPSVFSGGLGSQAPTLGPTWTVRVEEAFYLFWPVLLSKSKNYMMVFLIIIVTVLVIRYSFILGVYFFHFNITGAGIMKGLWFKINDYRFSCMAIGGIGAYAVVFEKRKILDLIYRKDVQWIVYAITFFLLALNLKHESIMYEPFSILFCIIIINLGTNPNTVIRLDYKPLNYLGIISYGIYLYNPIMRIFCLELTERLFGSDVQGWQANVFLYTTTILSTILISVISYEFFEKYFLNLKKKYSAVKI